MTKSQVVKRDDLMDQARGVAASQATTIEQSRAVAEVQGALTVAQQRPRDIIRAMNAALETCKTIEMAERAFFKFPRGGKSITGPTIHLAVELARCWGNIKYGIAELDRDDHDGRSEMLAIAWDLETNTQSTMTFIAPHKRDKRGGAEVLSDLRDIYENNANMGARRLRECIFRILPPSLIERAKSQCMATLKDGGGRPLVERLANMIQAYEKIGVARDRIEQKSGMSVNKMTELDVANLQVSWQSINRGEISAEQEFPKVLAAEIASDLKNTASKNITKKSSSTERKSDTQDQKEQLGQGDLDRNSGQDDTFPADLPNAQHIEWPKGKNAQKIWRDGFEASLRQATNEAFIDTLVKINNFGLIKMADISPDSHQNILTGIRAARIKVS